MAGHAQAAWNARSAVAAYFLKLLLSEVLCHKEIHFVQTRIRKCSS